MQFKTVVHMLCSVRICCKFLLYGIHTIFNGASCTDEGGLSDG